MQQDFGREQFFEMIDEKLEEIDEIFSDYEGKFDKEIKHLKQILEDARDLVAQNLE
jgi:hypothetical protein